MERITVYIPKEMKDELKSRNVSISQFSRNAIRQRLKKKELQKRWRKDNPKYLERARERSKEWRKKHPNYAREYLKKNPDKVKQHLKNAKITRLAKQIEGVPLEEAKEIVRKIFKS